jgi:hypothetical protein
MNKPFFLIAALGLLLATGLWIFWLAGNEVVLPSPPTVATDEADTEASVVSVEASLTSADFAEVSSDDSAEQPDRSSVEIELDDAPRLVIQVWNGKKGVVAPEADVFVLEGYQGPELRDAFAPHWCELAETKGTRYKASTEGQVELPRLKQNAIIAAMLPGASGMKYLRREHGEVEFVVLQPQETVTVRVLDARGRPVADVPVGIQQRIPERTKSDQIIRDWKDMTAQVERLEKLAASSAEANRAENRERLERRLASLRRMQGELAGKMKQLRQPVAGKVTSGKGAGKKPGKPEQQKSRDLISTSMALKARRRTDSNGLAVFQHFQLYRHRMEGWWPKEHRDQFEAVLMVPLTESVRQGFHGKPVSEEVIELRMPPTGSVALRTVDRDGRPFTHPVHGELRIRDGANPEFARMQIRKQQNEREIVFPFVGLGMQLDARCRLDDNDFRWRSPAFAGPQQAGERITVDLVVAPDAAMLYGRLLDATGTPLADAKTSFLINSIQGRLEGEEVLLDDAGRFHLPYQLRSEHQPPWRLQVRYQGRVPVPGLATTLAVLPKEGVMDIGDLQIDALTQITFGRVVDDLGQAIAGARVQLQREREVGRKPRISWQDEAFTTATTDEDGNFSLFGDLEAGRYRLRVTAQEHFPFEQPNLPGRDGVLIELPRRARVVGTVLTPKWLSTRSIKVRLECHTDSANSRDGQIHDYNGKQFIYFDWARPGVYSVSLRLAEFPDPFVTVSNFEIRAGQRDEHPRLKELDLGRDLYQFEVLAINEQGARMNPKSPLRARVMRPDGSYTNVGFNWKGGRAVIISAQSTLDVRPEESGYRAANTTLVAGRSEVQFLRVPPVTLRLPGMRQLVGDEKVWISMRMEEPLSVASFDSRSKRMADSIKRQSSSFDQLTDDDHVSLATLRDGRYAVVAWLGDKSRGGLVTVALGEVLVRAEPGAPPVELAVAVDAQAVQAALQDLAQRRVANPGGGNRGRK